MLLTSWSGNSILCIQAIRRWRLSIQRIREEMTREQNRPFIQCEHVAKPEQDERKGWFKRLLERLAKANKESGGQLCAS
jgi:predicted RNA-binding protein with RPS1 domain